jgi:hypothetical protein
MGTLGRSPLATQVPGMLDPVVVGTQFRAPWGMCLHTTGRGVPEKAAKLGRPALDVALDVYRGMQDGEAFGYKWGGPGYVIDHAGGIYQIAPDHILTAHCGGPHREEYLTGAWMAKCSSEAVARWRAKWGEKYKSPQGLFPSHSANVDYVGVEMIPIGSGLGGPPKAPGLLFTAAQHDAAVALARDLRTRHGWPPGWERTSRLVGHEDVQLIDRSDVGGGWDPGELRAHPYFDFESVRQALG